MEISDIKDNIEKILDDNKALNIKSINLKNKSYIADYMIIASGTSSRHLQALSEILVVELKKIGLDNCRIEGKDSSDWKLVDTQDIIVHIFHPEKRDFYDFTAKYESDDTEYICPGFDDNKNEKLYSELAIKAFNSLKCRGWGRVDFICDQDDSPKILEINTIPGMTKKSLVPKAAAKLGIDFDALCLNILETSI